MEICCRGGAGSGAGCATTGAARPRTATKARNAAWAKSATKHRLKRRAKSAVAHPVRRTRFDSVGKVVSHDSPHDRRRVAGDAPLLTLRRRSAKNLIIDHHAPWNTPDRDRNRSLASLEVDHRHVVAEAV